MSGPAHVRIRDRLTRPLFNRTDRGICAETAQSVIDHGQSLIDPEARRLLRWLSKRCTVAVPVMLKAQLDEEIAALDPVAIQAIERALAKAGVEFIAENGGGAGVRLRKVIG